MERIFQFLILVWLIITGGVASGAVIEIQPTPAAERITGVSSARLRTLPQTTSDEITRLPLGTIVQVLDQSAAKEKIGQIEDFWYHVKTDSGPSGWIFGGLTVPFDSRRREEIYLRIATDRLRIENKNFSEQVDLYRFLRQAVLEIKSPAVVAEVEFLQLLALSNSLRAIPFKRESYEPYASWLAAHRNEIVYSEPGGMWLVRMERFWELEKKYRALPIGERIAWQAAQYELPGECEGYIQCYFHNMSRREGSYLKFYPSGAHAGEAISKIDEYLGSYLQDMKFFQDQMLEISRDERSEFKRDIAEFRKVLMRTPSPKKNAMLNRLDQLSRSIP